MDRKMDSGYLDPGETMEDEYDFSKSLLPEEIIGIIDQLLCQEVRSHREENGQLILITLRWLGIKDTLSHRQSSPVCILTGSCHLHRSV